MITKPFSRFFATCCLFFFATTAIISAQNSKKKAPNFTEGVITYDFKMEGTGAAEIDQFMKGSTIQLFIKDSSACLDILFMNGLMHAQVIRNAVTNINVILLDIPLLAEKIAVPFPKNDAEGEDNDLLNRMNALDGLKDAPSPLTFKGKKRIAKYKCRKGTIDIPTGEGIDFAIYSTEKLRLNNPNIDAIFHVLGGFPLGLDLKAEGMSFEIFAKSVEKKTIPSNRFDVPKGYTEKDMEEFQELFQDKIGKDKIIGL
jgi:hypothetical protein